VHTRVSEADRGASLIGRNTTRKVGRTGPLPEVPSPGRGTGEAVTRPVAVIRRIHRSSDCIVWRPQRRPRTEAWTRRRDGSLGDLTSPGPLRALGGVTITVGLITDGGDFLESAPGPSGGTGGVPTATLTEWACRRDH